MSELQTAETAAREAGHTTRPINIGVHRGKPRLWLEGFWLEAAGFGRGEKYTAVIGDREIRLALNQAGDRVVSGKAKGDRHVPIVDMNTAAIKFSGKAIAYLSPGSIVIVPAVTEGK